MGVMGNRLGGKNGGITVGERTRTRVWANHLRERVLRCLEPERRQKLHDLSIFSLHLRVHYLLGGRRGRGRRQILKVAKR